MVKGFNQYLNERNEDLIDFVMRQDWTYDEILNYLQENAKHIKNMGGQRSIVLHNAGSFNILKLSEYESDAWLDYAKLCQTHRNPHFMQAPTVEKLKGGGFKAKMKYYTMLNMFDKRKAAQLFKPFENPKSGFLANSILNLEDFLNDRQNNRSIITNEEWDAYDAFIRIHGRDMEEAIDLIEKHCRGRWDLQQQDIGVENNRLIFIDPRD